MTSTLTKFPTLSVSAVCSTNDLVIEGRKTSTAKPFEANSLSPIPFETSLFRGHLLLLVRDDNKEGDDALFSNPYKHIFDGRQRTIEFQIQGMFLRAPIGTLFMGIEITQPMKLGLVTKGLCRMLLNFMQRFSKNLHFSFGDFTTDYNNNNNNHNNKSSLEYPHIVFPLKDLDRLVITKQGNKLPTLGSVIQETEESIAKRKHTQDFNEWNIADTYTMSFNTHYVDLPSWRIVNVPIMKDMDLRTFWGDSLARIVGYEFVEEEANNNNAIIKKHDQKNLNYLFCAQAQYIPEGREINDQTRTPEDSLLSEQIKESNLVTLSWKVARPSLSRSLSFQELDIHDPCQRVRMPSSPSTKSQCFPTHQSDQSSDYASDGYKSESSSLNECSVGGDTVYYDTQSIDDSYQFESSFWNFPNNESKLMMAFPPNKLCPSWIDFYERGQCTRLFALVLPQEEEFLIMSVKAFYSCLGRKSSFPSCLERAHNKSSPRISHSERLRRRMGHILSIAFQTLAPDALELCIDKLRNVSASNNRYMKRFMNENALPSPSSPSSKKRITSNVVFKGFIARAVSESHWVEQWASVTSSHVCFYHPDKKNPTYRISLQSVINVECIHNGNSKMGTPNIPQFYFSALETLGRTIYCMHATDVQCNHWVASISKTIAFIRGGCVNLHEKDGNGMWQTIGHTPDDPAQEYLHCSSMWSCKDRRILNCKKFLFDSTEATQLVQGEHHPCEILEQVLHKALKLNTDSTPKALCSFLDSAASLKALDVSVLSEHERKAFFINLYHVMIMHAFVVLGPPNSSFEWIHYFNMISYQCSDDIFSLSELEHRIIRAGMSPPSKFITKFVLPKTEYKNIALTKDDFRLNFALNCGSFTNPSTVLIYTVKNLNEQLDLATQLYLANSVEFRKGVFTLPRICHWYERDFGRQKDAMIRTLLIHFPEKVRIAIAPYLEEPTNNLLVKVVMKFSSYDYHCRFLTLSSKDP